MFINFENPSCPTKIEITQIIHAIIKYVLLFLVILLKNPYPEDIAVVNIAISTRIP